MKPKIELSLDDLDAVCGGAGSREGLSPAELSAATQGRSEVNRQKKAQADEKAKLLEMMQGGGGLGGLGGGGLGGLGF